MNSRRLLTSLITVLVLTSSMSCGAFRHHQAAPVVQPLERLLVTATEDRVRVELEGAQAERYSMSSTAEPPTVTLTLPGVSRGTAVDRMALDQGPVREVVPKEVMTPAPGLELTFFLKTAVKPEVRIEGRRVLVDFPKGSHTSAEEPAGSGSQETVATAAPSAVPSGTPGIAARTMTKVEIQRDHDQATVIIHGDGEFQYDVKPLNHDRLVVDLANVVSPLRLQLLPVDHPLLKQIRIGHHARRVRLVFDLPRPATYTLQPGAKTLTIRLAQSAAALGAGAVPNTTPEGGTLQKSVRLASTPSRSERLELLDQRPRLAQMAPDLRSGDSDAEEAGQRRYVGRRISLDFQQADITNVLRLIAEVSGFNIVVGEGVKAKVTLKLVSVPWDQALDMLLKMNNLGMVREGNIVWIDTLANIAKQQDEEARAKESKTKAEDLVTRVIYLQNINAQEAMTSLRQYVSPRGQLQFNQASNALVIRDTESHILAFREIVRDLDLQVPQVQIEARIVQADTNYSRSLGIQWGVQNLNTMGSGNVANFRSGNAGAFGEQTKDFLVNLPATVAGLAAVPSGGFSFGRLGADGFQLDLRISAGELLGLTKVIAAPKITTLDKREAKIEQGESIPFQTTSLQGTQTTFVDANLTLQVTPQITSRDPKEPNKQIMLKVRATRNFVGARSNPAGPSIAKREATTQVMVRDGETMVIGGVFIDEQTNNVAGVPWLSRIPVLGWLFKNKVEAIAKQELLVFITPTIVKSEGPQPSAAPIAGASASF